MERAYIGKLACLLCRVLPRFAGVDAVRIEKALGRDRVRERVFVDPDHRVSSIDRQRLGLVAHCFDDHGVGGRGSGGADRGAAAEHESERAGERCASWLSQDTTSLLLVPLRSKLRLDLLRVLEVR